MTAPRSTGNLTTTSLAALADATVLVVDDHPPNVLVLESLLRAAGLTAVHGLTDPRRAVSRCLELQPDLVLLDLHMPHMDGYAVMAALDSALPADTFLPVLVLTADDTTAARKRALEAGAKDFLTKPFDRVETVQRVRNLLETTSLYRTVQRHNADLQAELDHRKERDQRLAREHGRRRARVESVVLGDALSMVFQPIVELAGGRMIGVEALARFDCEPRRPPNEWFSEAADVGLGAELELAAVERALSGLSRLPSDAFVSINVSAATAAGGDLTAALMQATGSRVVLELTEHARIEDYGPLLAAFERLRRHGVRIAVDDAGAGYAGLQHLLRLRPDIIKLDRDLTRAIDADPARRALARSLVGFAKELDALIVAEGIETPDELRTLRTLSVPWGQGFYLARPTAIPGDRLWARAA